MDVDTELADPESQESFEQSTGQFIQSLGQSNTSSIQSNDTTKRAISLLDRLRPLRKSDLDRKRKTVTNPPCGKRKCTSTNSSGSSSTATIRLQQRLLEFKDEPLTVSNGKLFGKLV